MLDMGRVNSLTNSKEYFSAFLGLLDLVSLFLYTSYFHLLVWLLVVFPKNNLANTMQPGRKFELNHYCKMC